MDEIENLDEPRRSIAKFLKKNGWNVVLVGKTGVVKNPHKEWKGYGKYAYWFVMEFMGKKDEKEKSL